MLFILIVLFVWFPYAAIFMAIMYPAIMAIIDKKVIIVLMARGIMAQNMVIRVVQKKIWEC